MREFIAMNIRSLGFIASMVGFFGSLVCAGIALARFVYFLLSGHYESAETEFIAVLVFALMIWCFKIQLRNTSRN